MNNTTYTANQNCFLIDGEVYFIESKSKLNYWVINKTEIEKLCQK